MPAFSPRGYKNPATTGEINDPAFWKTVGENQDARFVELDANLTGASTDAAKALQTANAYAGQIAQANTTAGSAVAIAEGAASEVDEIKGPIDTRLTAVEVAAGYAPGDATDAAMTNIATQETTQFRAALNAQSVQATAGLYVPAELAMVVISHGDDANVARGDEPGRRLWVGAAHPVNMLDGVDLWAKPAARDPAVVPATGMLARFRAEALGVANGATVAAWADDTGTYTLTGTAEYSTAYGAPAVRTNGTSHYLSADALDRSQPNSIVVVGRFLAPAGGKLLVDTTGGTGRQTIGLASGNVRQAFAGATVTGGVEDGSAFHVWIATYNGATSELMVDGAVDVAGNFGSNNADGLRIGATPTLSAYSAVAVAEVIPYSRVLTTQEKTAVTASLRSHYGI